MADISKTLPLQRSSVESAHKLIKPYIHRTPVLTCTTLNDLASTPQSLEALIGTPFEGHKPARPKINFFFKCENYQRIGAFKSRGAFHALARLSEEELKNGVVTHSSGFHNQLIYYHCPARLQSCANSYVFWHRQSCPSSCSCRSHTRHTSLHRHAHHLHTLQNRRHERLRRGSHLQR